MEANNLKPHVDRALGAGTAFINEKRGSDVIGFDSKPFNLHLGKTSLPLFHSTLESI